MNDIHGLLQDPKIEAVLPRLLFKRKMNWQDMFARTKDLYLPLEAEQGGLLYVTARAIAARRIVEYGTSFGVSTLYLAAAVRDNGGGTAIGSEILPEKAEIARANFKEAAVYTGI